MPNPEGGYQPSPSEIREAEASMDSRQRELTETREDAIFEVRRQATESKNESKDSDENITKESEGSDQESKEQGYTVEQTRRIEYQRFLISRNLYEGDRIKVLRTSGEWDDGWQIDRFEPYVGGGTLYVTKDDGHPEGPLQKGFSLKEAQSHIR